MQRMLARGCTADFTKLVLIIAAAVLIGWQFSYPSNAADGESRPILASICADRDITVLTLIEDHGEIEDLPAEKISEAYITLLRARATCYAGETAQAVAQYDAISADLGGLHIDRREQARSSFDETK